MLYMESIERMVELSKKEYSITLDEVREFIIITKKLFENLLLKAGHDKRQITRLTTKFRDAGRRSAPWKPTSSRVPGRPQDGQDGNRINRWLLPPNHKFYADEKTATLVEIKYYFQALSMQNAPSLNHEEFQKSLVWLVGELIVPGVYLDPIQLISIDINEVIADARIIVSGHLIPLDQGGRHEPKNAFLMLKTSNDLQGSLTLQELLKFMEDILSKHRARQSQKDSQN